MLLHDNAYAAATHHDPLFLVCVKAGSQRETPPEQRERGAEMNSDIP